MKKLYVCTKAQFAPFCGGFAAPTLWPMTLRKTVFLKAYKNYGQLNSVAAAQFWLFGIAYRCFLDHARKEKRRNLLGQSAAEAPQSAPAFTASRLDLEAAMNDLPPDCRACIILCLAHGYTQDDAAQMTGLPLGTVKSHIHRGKAHLKTFLSAYETIS